MSSRRRCAGGARAAEGRGSRRTLALLPLLPLLPVPSRRRLLLLLLLLLLLHMRGGGWVKTRGCAQAEEYEMLAIDLLDCIREKEIAFNLITLLVSAHARDATRGVDMLHAHAACCIPHAAFRMRVQTTLHDSSPPARLSTRTRSA